MPKDGEDKAEPVSRYFPVMTPSMRERIETQRRINDSRKSAALMWAPILARLQEVQSKMRWVP